MSSRAARRAAGWGAVAGAVALAGGGVALLAGGPSGRATAPVVPPAARTDVASPLPGQVVPSVACPPVGAPGQPWPDPALSGVPVPAGAVVRHVERGGGAVVVTFTVPTDFRDAAIAFRAQLAPAGAVLVSGDQEGREVDSRFLSAAASGGIKFVQTGSCTATGYADVVDPTATGAPASPIPASLLPSRPA